MTKVWVCPACGERNALDASECASCGRWPSLFDLERTVDVDEDGLGPDDELWEPVDDAVPSVPSRADEDAPASVGPDAETGQATEQPAQPGGRSLLRWLLPLVAAGWILARVIAEQF